MGGEDLISIETAIHIHSISEFEEVVRYYEQEGLRTSALNALNCIDYPYLHIYRGDRSIITGSSEPGNLMIVEFDDWRDDVIEPIKPLGSVELLFGKMGCEQ